MTQPCGPYCSHPQCWKSSKLVDDGESPTLYESRKLDYSQSTTVPYLGVHTLNKDVQSSAFVHKTRVPPRHDKLMRDAKQSPETRDNILLIKPTSFNFAEMQLFTEDGGSRQTESFESYDNKIYKWVAKPRSPTSNNMQLAKMYPELFQKENTGVIHTVNLIPVQQALPAREKPINGSLIPPKTNFSKARELYKQRASSSNRDQSLDYLFEDPASEVLLNLIASSASQLSPRDTPLPAELAYKKYAATMLPKITRSDSVQTIIQRETRSSAGSMGSTRSKNKNRGQQTTTVPLTALTLQLTRDVANNNKISAITDRKVLLPTKPQGRILAAVHTDDALPVGTVNRIYSGLSTKPRQGSVKPSTASTLRENERRTTTPETIDESDFVDDPLGYLSARHSLTDKVENLSHLSDRGTDASPRYQSSLDSIEATLSAREASRVAVVDTREKIEIPIIDDILLLAASVMSPDSAAQSARLAAPPASPFVTTGGVSARSADAVPEYTAPSYARPVSPPEVWAGLFVLEDTDASIGSTRAPSEAKRGSPTSGLSSAIGIQREMTNYSLLSLPPPNDE